MTKQLFKVLFSALVLASTSLFSADFDTQAVTMTLPLTVTLDFTNPVVDDLIITYMDPVTGGTTGSKPEGNYTYSFSSSSATFYKITGAIDQILAFGLDLKAQLTPDPGRGTSTGNISLTNTAADLLRDIDPSISLTGGGFLYMTFSAIPAYAGPNVINRTATYTILVQ